MYTLKRIIYHHKYSCSSVLEKVNKKLITSLVFFNIIWVFAYLQEV